MLQFFKRNLLKSIIILFISTLLHLQVPAQLKDKGELHLSLTFGVNTYKFPVGDFSLLYKSKNNFTYGAGVGAFNTSTYTGAYRPQYSNNGGVYFTGYDNQTRFFCVFLNFGKIWAIQKSKFFINTKTGPIYNIRFNPTQVEGRRDSYGLQSSLSASYQIAKRIQLELGVNSNLNTRQSFAGIFLGVKLTGIRIK